MSGRHLRLWGEAAIQRDLGMPSRPAKHKAPHEHKWQCVGNFPEFAIFECPAKDCGETRTLWRSEIEVLELLEAEEWGAVKRERA